MSKLTVYLAGNCKYAPDGGKGWRDEITHKLMSVAEWGGKKIKVINPTKFFSYDEKKHKSNKQIKEFYMDKILKSDVVICNCNDSDKSIGTAQEVQFAVDHHVPVIGFGKSNTYPWIVEVDCQVVFDEMSEAVNYIKDYYLI